MTRKPAVADQFYDGDFENVEKQITNCFEGKLGPGALPVTKREDRTLAIIAPHAGYFYSGQCAAWAYKEIGESKLPDLYIMLGPDHTGSGSSVSSEDWVTPFGNVTVDNVFAETLQQFAKEGSGIEINNEGHENEHSIEVQLPFLQFVNKEAMKKIKILPIMISHDIDIKKLSADIKKTILQTKRDVCFIVSSDFTHYGDQFGFTPFIYNIKDNIKNMDMSAIKAIESLDSGNFLNNVKKSGATICGALPIAVLLDIIWQDVEKMQLLSYYTSCDVTESKDYSQVVSYASIVFK